jgi:hypothetical protein
MFDQSRRQGFALAAVAITSAGLLLAGCGGSEQTSQANQRWANTVCTNMLAWQKQVHRDETSFNLAFGPRARLDDVIGATRRLASELAALGLPATQRGSRAQTQFGKLGSAVQTKLTEAQAAADKLETGDVNAAGVLISDVPAGADLAVALLDDAHQLASTDLAIAVVDTKTCRQLAGLPV